MFIREEKSSCGVGFVAHRGGLYSHQHLLKGLHGLKCMEHRGACGADQLTGDGAGIMTDIPFRMLGYAPGSVAVATIFIPVDPERQELALNVFQDTFNFMGLEILEYRDVPTDPTVLGEVARLTMPAIKHAIIKRPTHCRTDASFDKVLHNAKQHVRIKQKENGIIKEFFFTSLSATTIIYKALTPSHLLEHFYLDLQNPTYKTRFALFHRRFSTNTRTSWDKAQPFRLIGHNGEINTIASNRSWGYSREKSLGLQKDELLTHSQISDSGNLNEMVEALMYRSSIPNVEDILAIMMPPAHQNNAFYSFWSRAMEPWDGPAIILYSDGETIGARLDRNGFRPGRWATTEDIFYLSSEAGSFEIDESEIIAKGSLHAGSSVTVELNSGAIHFRDPSESRENEDAHYDPRLFKLSPLTQYPGPQYLKQKTLFTYTKEDVEIMLLPMIIQGKEPIGSMGDTARLAVFSEQPRSFFDYFYQQFAQVTNPSLDYLREKMVTALTVHLGTRPNIFEPKDLIPQEVAFEASSPVLSLVQMQYIEDLKNKHYNESRIRSRVFDMTFERNRGVEGFKEQIYFVTQDVLKAVNEGISIIILSDRQADYDHPPIPSLLMLRAVINGLNESGLRLRASIVVHSAEIKNSHHLATLIGFGAAAVCPYLALEIACYDNHPKLMNILTLQKEQNLIKAFEMGLLKIMAKSGISVVKSYQSSKRFTAVGLGPSLIESFFPGLTSPIGGLEVEELVEDILKQTEHSINPDYEKKLLHTYLYREHNKGLKGERHSMTAKRSKAAHQLLDDDNIELTERYQQYLQLGHEHEPVNIRHLFELNHSSHPLEMEQIQSRAEVLKTFGSGAMSFGAISAEAQRDIFLAMREIGGRCNSGEGGENPYYYSDGITATTKQVASGRFGVTAEYLICGEEIQIKIAQGAKPGEGGQLMKAKVNKDIAKARHSLENIDLISPPPLHDIYSIEDLKELIYELKQLKPDATVSVKLVSVANVGTIAVGVAKAGADVIYISGYDGGTGAATLTSMKHAGLPWEFGLIEAHEALIENNLRNQVILRTDGGLHTGKDIIIAAILGAEGFEFGKLLLIAEGCIMARVCEKNTCPRGIATHDPKFKARYSGSKEAIIKMLSYLAEEVRHHLSKMGVKSLTHLHGRTDLLKSNPLHQDLIQKRKLSLNGFLKPVLLQPSLIPYQNKIADISTLNQQILEDTQAPILQQDSIDLFYSIKTTDRATLATLSGKLAHLKHQSRFNSKIKPFNGKLKLTFRGSAGQGFGVFLTRGIEVHLFGEANDSVCKSMSGGKVIIRPHPGTRFRPGDNTIIGNCALYGATGGTLYVSGQAGDRFAIRNSGCTAVVEGAGLHACEYMTNGLVVILGKVSYNVGAGMTGGTLFLSGEQEDMINSEYLISQPLTRANESEIKALLDDYLNETGSLKAKFILRNWNEEKLKLKKYVPIGLATEIASGEVKVTKSIKGEL